jgi:hypothetical protein
MPSNRHASLASSGHASAFALVLALLLASYAPLAAQELVTPTAGAAAPPAPPAAPAAPRAANPPEDSIDAAFGLRWFDSKAEVESLGVELRAQESTPFGDSYTTGYLPRNVPDMNYAVLSFGYNDQLIHITAVGGDFVNDNEARQAVARYKELKDVLEKKYGAGESDAHTEKVFSGSLTALGFQQKKNWMYTVFKQPHMRIELSVISIAGARMGWRLIFENLDGMAQMEKQRRRSEEAAF